MRISINYHFVGDIAIQYYLIVAFSIIIKIISVKLINCYLPSDQQISLRRVLIINSVFIILGHICIAYYVEIYSLLAIGLHLEVFAYIMNKISLKMNSPDGHYYFDTSKEKTKNILKMDGRASSSTTENNIPQTNNNSTENKDKVPERKLLDIGPDKSLPPLRSNSTNWASLPPIDSLIYEPERLSTPRSFETQDMPQTPHNFRFMPIRDERKVVSKILKNARETFAGGVKGTYVNGELVRINHLFLHLASNTSFVLRVCTPLILADPTFKAKYADHLENIKWHEISTYLLHITLGRKDL